MKGIVSRGPSSADRDAVRAGRVRRAAVWAAAALFATSGAAYATPGGVFSSTTYTAAAQMSDTNVGLSTNKFYQNNANINGPALTINNVPFAIGGTTSGTNWTLTGATTPFTTNNGANNLIAAGQQLRSLVTDFTYGGNPGVLTLNGLTSGQTYTVTAYGTGFGAVRVMSTVSGTSGTDVAAISNYNEDGGGTGNGTLLRYTFVANGTSVALSATPAVVADTFHWYGFSNEQVFTNTYNQTTGGSFNTGANWSNTLVPALNNTAPAGPGSNAAFPAQASATVVTLDAATTLGHLQFDGTNGYILSGSNALTIQTDNPGGVSVLSALAGTHTVGVPVTLANDAAKLGTGTLIFGNTFAGGNRVLTVGNGFISGTTGTTFQSTVVALNVDNGLILPAGIGTFTVGALAGSGNFAMVDQSATPITLQVGNSTATYSGVLSGTTGLTKVGTGTQTLSGANTFSGVVTINAGILAVTALGNAGAGGTPSPLGVGSNAPASIVLNGGSLGYSGATATSTDRQFTVGTGGGGLDSSGAGAVTFASTAPITFSGTASARTFNLSGTNTGANTFNGLVADSGAGTALTTLNKAGTGTWFVTGANTYTGETLFNGGVLNVSGLSNYGVAGPLGARPLSAENAASNTGIGLHFNGGTLQYTGATAQSTDREIRVSLAGATFDASGSVPAATLSFTHSGTNTNLFDTAGARTITLTGTNTGNNSFAIQLTNQAAALTSLTKAGAGTWVLPAATTSNSYTGVTALTGGVLNVASVADYGVNSSIGARTAAQEVSTNIGLLFRGGTLQYTGSTPQSTNRQIRISTVGGAFIDASGSTPTATLSFTFSGTNADLYENAGARQVTLTGSNTGLNTFAIKLTDQAATPNLTTLNKTGTGTWVLTGASTATGATTVSAGTLIVNGSTASPTTVTGGTLGGSGTIAGPVTISSGASIAPGNSPGILGTGNLSLAAGSTASIELNGTTAGAASGGYDQINVTGTVTLGGGNLAVAVGYSPALNDSFTIINNDSTDAVSGTFAGLPTSGSTLTVGSRTFAINYAGGDGNDVVLTTTAVPEPAAAGLLAAAAAGLLGARRRRRAR